MANNNLRPNFDIYIFVLLQIEFNVDKRKSRSYLKKNYNAFNKLNLNQKTLGVIVITTELQ